MTRYIWTDEGFKNRNGERMPIPERDGVCSPMVVSDMDPVSNPITGEMITSRSELRYQLEKHDKRIIEPSESPTKGKLRNAKFAAKRGLKLSDEYRDYDSSTKKAAAK